MTGSFAAFLWASAAAFLVGAASGWAYVRSSLSRRDDGAASSAIFKKGERR